MPRRTRTRRLPRQEYGKWHRFHLTTGTSFKGRLGPDFGYREDFDPAAAVAAWAELREEILREHIAAHPCTRPWAWWELEGDRELRRRVDGGAHPCDVLGLPSRYGLPCGAYGPEDVDALYESVAAYLARLGLLTRREKAYIENHPEILNPVDADDGRGWR